MSGASDILSKNGILASHLPNYEYREAQIEMSSAVDNTISNEGVLLAEAGTGTGKTLAYLVPAILSELRVIISTGTKNLQEQVFFKEIGFLKNMLGRPINAVYLKGQENYLCIRRFNDFMRSPRMLSYAVDQVAEIEQWYKTTDTGDRMEIAGLGDEEPVWREICSTQETRIGSKCPFFDECFVTRARQSAAKAAIVVVNHHLYFADMASRMRGGSVLPRHDAAIFDEAHMIEDVATEFFSVTVSSARIDRLIGDVLGAVRAARLSDDPAEDRRDQLSDWARKASRRMFSMFRGSSGRSPLVPEEMDPSRIEAYHGLDLGLEALEQSLLPIKGKDDVLDHSIERLAKLRDDLAMVLVKKNKGFVHWYEDRQRTVAIGASPIDVSEIVREGLFWMVPSVVLTSATLSTGGDFSFLKARLGIDFDSVELSLPSPFDYKKQACIYLPPHLADPREDGFAVTAADESAKLIEITGGGALILSTSLRNMKAIYDRLEGTVPGPLLLQGEAPKSMLLARFLDDPKTVLCATTSFWQGVDLPGNALRLVIIDKLPFASPADPLIAARIKHLEEQGKNPFVEYQIPSAALALKQGFGRLIRTRSDRGVVAILDSRLHTMPYAKAFLKSLPSCPRIFEIDAVRTWWSGGIEPDPNVRQGTS